MYRLMHEASYAAEAVFRRALDAAARPPMLQHVDVEFSASRYRVGFWARFYDAPDQSWSIRLSADLRFDRRLAEQLSLDTRRLYDRLRQRHCEELEVAPQRELLEYLWSIGAPGGHIADAERNLDRARDRARRRRSSSFGSPDLVDSITYSFAQERYVVDPQINRLECAPELAEHSERMSQLIREAMLGIARDALAPEGRNEEAQQRGLALLKEWLSPQQVEQYRAQQSFEVIGSDTGKRYRIRHGTQLNIDELDVDGLEVCTWCFLPVGRLVAGDVMLAQKIALETDERASLKVANRFPPGGQHHGYPEIDLRPGAINYVSNPAPRGWLSGIFNPNPTGA